MIKRMLKKTWDWAKPYFTWRMAPFLFLKNEVIENGLRLSLDLPSWGII